MKWEDLPVFVRESVSPSEFGETVEKNRKCPSCGRSTVERRIDREGQQDNIHRWYVEHCTVENCGYWNCGFTTDFSDNPIIKEKVKKE